MVHPLLFLGIVLPCFWRLGGVATYMEAIPDKLFLLVSEEEVVIPSKGRRKVFIGFLDNCSNLSLPIRTLVFSHGLWLASLSRLCAFTGSSEVLLFDTKPANFILRLAD